MNGDAIASNPGAGSATTANAKVAPSTLYYTFGNHMHWVDMEWLWGYFVLPSSVRDMLALCAATGAKGNNNFDAVGYEKMAAESPEALAELRAAVAGGTIEPVGCSYGQPYGLFHGGESNLRQRVYGARVVRRLLGVWPVTFWEEEFDFFPQLPQMLASAGFRYASLFFQWTWHTPHIPAESLPAIWWEGMDGSRLLTATRNALNLHQWPEDFAGLLDGDVPRTMPAAGIQQWLELMPSPDWMCRSEVLLPQLEGLMADPRYAIHPVTLSEYLEIAKPFAQPRRYTLDDVFHGMSLGKNGDLFRRRSRATEAAILAAESLSTLAGYFGRPYPGWNVYPTWELEEAWRELMIAQHHDNDECEGMMGHIGLRSYDRGAGLAADVTTRTLRSIATRTAGAPGRTVAFNPLGWSRAGLVASAHGPRLVRQVPPFGYVVLDDGSAPPAPDITVDGHIATIRRGELAVEIDTSRGVIHQLRATAFPDGCLDPAVGLLDLRMERDGERELFERVTATIDRARGAVVIERRGRDDDPITIDISLAPELDAVDVRVTTAHLPRPDGWWRSALRTTIGCNFSEDRLIHDHPYGVSEIAATGKRYLRKYPTGDWMTSPQVFEEIDNPFTALSLLDFTTGDRGLLLLHDGSQAFQRDHDGIHNVLSMNDPWDEDYFVANLDARYRFVPHGALTNGQRWRLAQEFNRPLLAETTGADGGELPRAFGPVWCDAANLALTAFYREEPEAGAYLEHYAGAGIAYPTVLRIVELDGIATQAEIRLAGPVARATRATARGDELGEIAVTAASAPAGMAAGPGWNAIQVEVRPYEIATIYLDLELNRKVTRDLDARRSVWATVHRVHDTPSQELL